MPPKQCKANKAFPKMRQSFIGYRFLVLNDVLIVYTRVGADYDYNRNRLHFLCNHNHNRNHTFSKLDVIVIMLCNHL